jgi:hypothetical protein
MVLERGIILDAGEEISAPKHKNSLLLMQRKKCAISSQLHAYKRK